MSASRFELHRDTDVTGVSGTGVVAEGIEFSDGTVALRWLGGFPTSVVFHDRGMESVQAVHGHSGSTRIVYLDGCICDAVRALRPTQPLPCPMHGPIDMTVEPSPEMSSGDQLLVLVPQIITRLQDTARLSDELIRYVPESTRARAIVARRFLLDARSSLDRARSTLKEVVSR